MTDENESQIVKLAQCGDMNSFGKLYERYYTAMVWLAYSILNDYDLSEDTVQETFSYACDGLIELRSLDKFGPWLTAICRNVACRMAKRRNREVTLNEPSRVLEQNTNTSLEGAVREAIANLHQMYRELVILHYYNGMSYEQIESFLGIPRSKVKGRLFSARKKIGKYLQSKGLNGEDEL
ncbi:RNA polymerase sigma factor [Planctomycetota bacterium]